jgi:predicted DNA-binding transcriptional regulator AlpA
VTYEPPDPLLTAEQSAAEVGLSLPGFWKAVQTHRMPSPVYPLPRPPRWRRSALQAAVQQTRALPAEQKAARRAEKLARQRRRVTGTDNAPTTGEHRGRADIPDDAAAGGA